MCVQTVWVPVLIVVMFVLILAGTFYGWKRVRRQREIELMEALRRAEEILQEIDLERAVDFGEKPSMFDVYTPRRLLLQSEAPLSKVSSLPLEEDETRCSYLALWLTVSQYRPLSAWHETQSREELDGGSEGMPASAQISGFSYEFRRLRTYVRSLKAKKVETPDASMTKPESLSVALFIRMPMKINVGVDDCILPELALGIEKIIVV